MQQQLREREIMIHCLPFVTSSARQPHYQRNDLQQRRVQVRHGLRAGIRPPRARRHWQGSWQKNRRARLTVHQRGQILLHRNCPARPLSLIRRRTLLDRSMYHLVEVIQPASPVTCGRRTNTHVPQIPEIFDVVLILTLVVWWCFWP